MSDSCQPRREAEVTGFVPEPNDPLAMLLSRVIEGDAGAAREVYLRWRPHVMRVLSSFGQLDRDDVEDLVQDTFVRAFRGMAKLRRADTFEGWLLAIARNRALTVLAKRERGNHSLHRFVEAAEDSVDFVPVWLREEVEASVIRQAIAELPEGPEKDTVSLFYVEGELSTREIGERMSVGKSAVTMRLERFRTRMREELVARVLQARWEP